MTDRMPANVLLTGAGMAFGDETLSVLKDAGFAVRLERWHSEVPELVESQFFDAIVVELPLPGVGLGVLLSSIRAKAARCREAGLVILTPEDDIGAVDQLVGHGVNRVLLNTATPSEVLEAIETVRGAAHRITVHLPVQLEVTLPAGDSVAICQTENLSESGMLVRGAQHYPLGTRISFEMQIPGTDRCLEGIAEVTRMTNAKREHVEGFGARFVEMNSLDRWVFEDFFSEKDEPCN